MPTEFWWTVGGLISAALLVLGAAGVKFAPHPLWKAVAAIVAVAGVIGLLVVLCLVLSSHT